MPASEPGRGTSCNAPRTDRYSTSLRPNPKGEVGGIWPTGLKPERKHLGWILLGWILRIPCGAHARSLFSLSKGRFSAMHHPSTRQRRAIFTWAFCGLLAFAAAVSAQPSELPPLLDRQLFFGDPEIIAGQLSPDGKLIAFIKPLDGTRNVWVK